MKAGYSRIDITPPLGTPLMGWGKPWQRLSTGVHDPLYARVLWLEDGDEQLAIVGLDLCFIGRDDADRVKGVLARELDLLPRQVLLSASHTHAGPAVGNYLDMEWEPSPRGYLRQLDAAILEGIRVARQVAIPVSIRATKSTTSLPMNRRAQRNGEVTNAPNEHGPTYDALPVTVFEAADGKPIAVLFAASTHPVCFSGTLVSADYPGVAMAGIDRKFGKPCSLFLQGMGGDSRPRTLASGDAWVTKPGTAQTEQTGKILAGEVLAALGSLQPVQPMLRSALLETRWPLNPVSQEELEREAAGDYQPRANWARDALAQLKRGSLPDTASILLQAFQLGDGLRLVSLEGEPLHPYGQQIEAAFDRGITFATGYSNGEGMYIVTTPMLDEGGYEPGSYWEYHQAGPLAPGMEKALDDGLARIKAMGIA